MPARPWFPFNAGDYMRDTAHLSLEEHGAYIKLLAHAWVHDGELPKEMKRIARILGVHTNKAKTLWGFLSPFWYETHGGYRQKRMDRELAKCLDISEQRAEAGRRGGQASAQAKAQANDQADHNPHSSADAEENRASRDIPEWLDESAWNRWRKHRSEIRKPLKPSTVEAQWRKLDEYRADGHDPADVIEHSIAGGWQGLFPPDKRRTSNEARGGRSLSAVERVEKANRVGSFAESNREPVGEDDANLRPQMAERIR